MRPDPVETAVNFDRAREADRRIAGVAAAARIVRRLAERGTGRVTLSVPGGKLGGKTLADISRLCPEVTILVADRRCEGGIAAPRLSTSEVLLATAKPSDGPVSRWLNRPISRLLSALILLIPAVRPIHATLGTVLLAIAMFAALLAGGPAGLVAGGLLFHGASIFDGVDGEIARATFRTSRLGALLDSVVDMATNLLFILGITINLAATSGWALPLGAWGLVLFILGLVLIGRNSAGNGRPFSMDGVKHRYRHRFPGSAWSGLIRFLTIVSSRDFFALLFAVLILAGLPLAVLQIFAAAATVWILFVLGAVGVPVRAAAAERNT